MATKNGHNIKMYMIQYSLYIYIYLYRYLRNAEKFKTDKSDTKNTKKRCAT